MATRNQNLLSLSHLSGVLLALVLLLVNIAAARMPVRLDLTEEGIYTLSPGSEQILGSLEDPATIKVFWYKVPESGESQRRDLDALLEEMQLASRGRLAVRWVDLEDEDGQREAEEAGIERQAFTAMEGGQLRAAQGYNSLLIEVGAESEQIPQLLNLRSLLEYEIVSRLHRMTRTQQAVIGLVAPRPAFNPFGGGMPQGRFRALEQFLGARYGDLFRATVSLGDPVPPDVNLLLVVAPESLEEKAVFHLEQFLLRGGHVLLLLDPVHAGPVESPNTQPTPSGLDEWLAHLGVTVEQGVVGDEDNFVRRPRQSSYDPRAVELLDYPFWPVLRGDHLDQDNPALRGFDQVPLFWPAALSIDLKRNEEGGRKVTVLARTTSRGFKRGDLFGLDQADSAGPGVTFEEVPLIALLEGSFDSFWKGRAAPGEASEDAAADAGDGESADTAGEEGGTGEEAAASSDDTDEAPTDEAQTSKDESQPSTDEGSGPERLDEGTGFLLVMTDAELVDDTSFFYGQRIGPVFANGHGLGLNLVDWASGSDELLALRTRDRNERTLEKIEPKDQRLVMWINLAGVPLLVLFAGVVVFLVRRYQR